MKYHDYRGALDELSASEGVFTAAQAMRLGIPRQVLSRAFSEGHVDRLLHGAYRVASTPPSETDELSAVWKLTAPTMFTGERMTSFDGIVIGGSSAASLLNLGDLWLSPYRLYAPSRINSRLSCVRFGVRCIEERDVTWLHGLPVTRPERTLVDLCLDGEDPSLVEDAFSDARAHGIDDSRLYELIALEGKGQRTRKLLGVLREHFGEGERIVHTS